MGAMAAAGYAGWLSVIAVLAGYNSFAISGWLCWLRLLCIMSMLPGCLRWVCFLAGIASCYGYDVWLALLTLLTGWLSWLCLEPGYASWISILVG